MIELDLIIVISLFSIVIMFYALWLVVHLKKEVPAGVVSSVWNILIILILFFSLGYLTTPFFRFIPEDIMRLVVAFIFFFGAIYVVMTVRLTYRIIRGLSGEDTEVTSGSKMKQATMPVSESVTRKLPGKKTWNVAKTLDCRGLFCPLPVVNTSNAIKELSPGEILELLATDPASKPDITVWAARTGNQLLEAVEEGSVFRYFIRKV